MTAPANADLVAAALLRYFRDPAQYPVEMFDANESLNCLELVVRLALGRPVELVNPALRTPRAAHELARAALHFAGQVLFREGASHYQVLGLAPDASAASIREHHRLLIQLVHPDRHNEGLVWPEGSAARVNCAYSVLKNADTRATYSQPYADVRARSAAAVRTATVFSRPFGIPVRRTRQVPPQILPEWITAGVGGFVRQHTAFAIFAGLISICVLTVGAIAWSEREGSLTRGLSDRADVQGAAPVVHSNVQPNYMPKAPLAVMPQPTTVQPPAAPATPALPQVADAPANQSFAAINAPIPQPASAPSRPEPQTHNSAQAPDSAAVEALINAFISNYESGQLDAFAVLFDADARTNESHGRAAIRNDYGELFRRSRWRRMNLKLLSWHPVGERTEANGEFAVAIGWHDGREVEQRIAVEMELVRVGGRTVIARLSQQVRN